MFENKNLNAIILGFTAISGVTFVLITKSNNNLFRKWFYNIWDDIDDIKNNLNTLNSKIDDLNKKITETEKEE